MRDGRSESVARRRPNFEAEMPTPRCTHSRESLRISAASLVKGLQGISEAEVHNRSG